MVKIGSVTVTDIADIEFLWGGGVGCAQSFSCLTSNYIEVTLLLSWGCDNSEMLKVLIENTVSYYADNITNLI